MTSCSNCNKTFSTPTTFCTGCGWRISDVTVPLESGPAIGSTTILQDSKTNPANSRNMLYFTIMVVAVSVSAVVLAVSLTGGNSPSTTPATEVVPAPEASQSTIQAEPDSSNYIPEMNLLLTEYSSSRTSLSKFVGRIDSGEYVSVTEAESFFDSATKQRQDILDKMNALTPPPNLAGNHGEIVSIIGRAITAMNSANTGIAACDFGVGECEIGLIPAWQEFRAESKQITPLYNSALNAWKKAAGVS
jgi:hypothetical protein